MTATFMEWVISASALILVVLCLRGLLGKRISAGLRYGLWTVVLIRLLVPISLTVTVPQLPKWTPPEVMQEESVYVLPVSSLPLGSSGVHVAEDGTLSDPSSFGYPRLTNDGEHVVRYVDKITPLALLKWIWISGAAALGIVLMVFNLRFSRRLQRVRRPLEGTNAPIPVYVAPALPSPCLVGLFFPAVYVTEEAAANPVMLRHVLAHELTHYNHRDHLWSVLRGVALAVHWWNPLVWLAVVCSRRDGELACDEGALKQLGDSERAAYGETLLSLVTAKVRPADLLSLTTTMSGGKRSLRERIQRIARQPKQLVSAVVAVVIVLSLSVLVAFGQASKAETPDTPVNREPPVTSSYPADAWQNAEITLDENGVPHILYTYPNGSADLTGNPIPAPREWADLDTLDSRKEAAALDGHPAVWARLVSETDGWLVACYERGVAAADTYIYKTEDGGMNWTEVTMPGTSWHIADVGFLSPERLIVAQRLFDGAPCFITKDGGETWVEIELPDTQVLSIGSIADTVYMDIGAHESDPATFTMTSSNMGDSWTVSSPAGLRRFILADLDHDGLRDSLQLWQTEDSGFTLWKLDFTASYMSSPTWEGEAIEHHTGWTSFFLCHMNGEEYLLQYTPYMSTGNGYYSYKLFYLTASGGEVVIQKNSVEFDINFDLDSHQFYPETISAFMEEINALLAQSELLVNTDENLIGTFRQEGRLYDSLWWLDDIRNDGLTLLDALRNYAKFAGGYPDGSAAFPEMDLDHDGKPDTLDIRTEPDPSGWSYDGTLWTLQCDLSGGGTWEIEGRPSLPGENAVFFYQMDGEDYLLVYTPEFWHGLGYYDYRVIWLDGGREVVVQENSVEFDTRFRGGPEDIGFDPEAIAAFMDEVNALLANSEQLVNTNVYLQQVFAGHGRLYDDLYWLDDKWREDGLTMLEILQNYGSYFGDHPDSAWSILADLLEGLTEEDIPMFNGDTAELVRMLRSAERGSRFYTWNSEAAAYVGHGAEEEDYTIWNLPLADGSALWLLACEERPSVLMIYETQEETVSAFYDAPELRDAILGSSAVPNIQDLLSNITADSIHSMSGVGIIGRDEMAQALNRISSQTTVCLEDREADLNCYFMAFTRNDTQRHYTMFLEAGESEGKVYLYVKGPFSASYSGNPENFAGYQNEAPYTVVGEVDDAELWQLIAEHSGPRLN